MPKKSKPFIVAAVIAVLGLSSQAFAKGQPTPEWQAQTYTGLKNERLLAVHRAEQDFSAWTTKH